MLTQTQVAAEMSRLGHPVTLRRLTDWRSKGLLPPLIKSGLGRKHGTVNLWLQPDIVEQAVLVHKSLAAGTHAKDALIAIWVRGYTIPLVLVRKALIYRWAKSANQIKRHTSKYGGLQKVLFHGADHTARQISRKSGLQEDMVRDLLLELLLSLMDHNYKYGEVDPLFLTAAMNDLWKDSSKRRRPDHFNEENIVSLIWLMKNLFSIKGRIKLLRSLTDEELNGAREQWQSFWGSFQSFSETIQALGSSANKAKLDGPPAKRLPIQLGSLGLLLCFPIKDT